MITTIAPDMINTIEILLIIAIPDLPLETTLILVIDLKAITLEITLTPLETINIHTAVLLDQDKMIDQDMTDLTQTQEVGNMNLLLIMLNLPLTILIQKLMITHHLKLT